MKKEFYLAVAGEKATKTDRGISVPAIAFVEGTQTPVGGKPANKSANQINTYSTNSNKWLDSGREIPFFESPHDLKGAYSNEDKIGLLGRFTSRPLTENDLPNEKFSDLVGKTAALTTIEITRPDAVENYNNGLIKEISVGVGNMGEGLQFFEASAVPWGAVRGAQLYGHPVMDGRDEVPKEEAQYVAAEQKPSDESDQEPKIYALTLDGAIAEREKFDDAMTDSLRMTTRLFVDVVHNIRKTTEAELAGRDRNGLINQALADLQTKVRTDLGIPPLTPLPAGENFMFDYSRPLSEIVGDLKKGEGAAQTAIASLQKESGLTAEQFTAALDPSGAESIEHYGLIVGAIQKQMTPKAESNALSPEVEERFSAMQTALSSAEATAKAAEEKLAALEAKSALTDRYTALRTKAAQLNAAGKLSAEAFLAFFPKGELLSDGIERFSAVPVEGQDKPMTLDEVEAQLNFVDKYGKAVVLGSVSGQDSVDTNHTSESDADVERYIKNHRTMTADEKAAALAELKSA